MKKFGVWKEPTGLSGCPWIRLAPGGLFHRCFRVNDGHKNHGWNLFAGRAR
jgi:hypothetical protein